MTPRLVPFERYPGLSPLFLDFLEGLPEFYPDPPTVAAATSRGKELLGTPAKVPAAAFRCRLPRAREMAQELAAGRAVAVLAGHQVGLFTGPVYTLSKAFDAIRVAREISRQGVPAVPVFWALTDDHDLEEIARTARPGAEGPEVLVLEGAGRANRRPVGRLPIPERVRDILDSFRADGKAPDAEETLEIFARRYMAGQSYGEAFLETLLDLVGEEPLLALDPMHEALRGPTSRFFRLAVERRDRLREVVRVGAERLERAGKPVPVPYRPGVFPFFLIEEGERRRVGDPEEALRLVETGKAWPSTDVLTRPALKSFLVPAAASVIGPAEIAYHAQALPLFPIFDLRPPTLLPRSHLVLLGPAERRAAEALGVVPEELLADRPGPEASRVPQAEEIGRIARTLEESLAALGPELSRLDPTLSGALETAGRKAAYQLEQLSERIRKAAERKDATTQNRRKRLETMLRPNGTTGERLYPPLVPMLAHGRAAVEDIRRAATGSTAGAAIVNLGAGRDEEDRRGG